MQILQVQTVVV